MPQSSLKILIVEDITTSTESLASVIGQLGHLPVSAGKDFNVLELCKTEAPDLIFLDIPSAQRLGMSVMQSVRAVSGDKWVPIILYAASDEIQTAAKMLDSVGDDYISKPVNAALLRAKINTFARSLNLQQKVHADTRVLNAWREQTREQSLLGKHVMERLTDAEGLHDPMLEYFNLAAEDFSGDLLCAARAPGGVFYVMLADAAGHGLPAALTALPLTQVFYSMAAKGFPLSSIAEELNRKLKLILPADRFVAAGMAAIDIRNHTIEVWNGGAPDVLFVTLEGVVAMRWISRHPPLGILPTSVFSAVTETVEIHEPGDLVLCSDGLIEAQGENGISFGVEETTRLLTSIRGREQRMQALRLAIDEFLAGHQAHDDISCMMISLPIDRRRNHRYMAPGVIEHHNTVQEWRLELSYGATELRYIDVVPSVLGFLLQHTILKPHQGTLFLIISELFNNALDHGLLALDSVAKDWTGGFEIYMQQREERLAQLGDGRVDLEFQIHQEGRKALLDVRISDSGQGFDYLNIEANELAEAGEGQHPHGRGIPLVRGLCETLIYSGNGSRVWARYLLSMLADSEMDHELEAGSHGFG